MNLEKIPIAIELLCWTLLVGLISLLWLGIQYIFGR